MGLPSGNKSKETAAVGGDIRHVVWTPGWGRSPRGRHGNRL